MKSEGLGDSLSKVFHALKIDKVADAVAAMVGAEGCGCDERRELLNKLFPYEYTSRKFTALKDFTMDGINYKAGQNYNITKKDVLHYRIIEYVKDGYLKEI